MTSNKVEIERLCEAEGNPPLLQEWGAPLRTMGVMNSVGFLSQHEGLRTEVPTAEGVTSMLISLRAIIGAQFQSLTQLIDAGSDAGADSPAAGVLRAQARAAMVMLHMLAVQQKTHCVNDQLASTGLGDSEARLEAESRRKKENASRAAATMRDAMTAVYNKPYDPELWVDALLYVTMREGFMAKELRNFPDLSSPKLGKRGYQTEGVQRVVRRPSKSGAPAGCSPYGRSRPDTLNLAPRSRRNTTPRAACW